MRVELMFPSKYVKAVDIEGKDRALTIESVKAEKLQRADGDSDQGYVVTFKGAKKAWVLNKTNAKTIAKIHGKETDNWVGKRITLFATTCDAFGETVDCIRVRPVKPKTQRRKAPAPHNAETGEVAEEHNYGPAALSDDEAAEMGREAGED